MELLGRLEETITDASSTTILLIVERPRETSRDAKRKKRRRKEKKRNVKRSKTWKKWDRWSRVVH